MRRFSCWVTGLASLLLLAATGPAQTEEKISPDAVSRGAVTILTDGIADPASPAARAVRELAERLGQIGKLRVLPLAGRGGADNVRDILHLRGVDFAILNSDILAYVAAGNAYPAAPRKIRYAAKLFDQKALLFARREIESLEQLAGRKLLVLGEESDAYVSARTVFHLLGINVHFGYLKAGASLDDVLATDADGIFILAGDLAHVAMAPHHGAAFRVLPIRGAGLATVYEPAVLSHEELGVFLEAGAVDTIKVSTLLAVFDWPASQQRHADTVNFIAAFYGALPGLRRDLPDSIWRSADINASIPGWQRYSPADALRKAALAREPSLSSVETPNAVLDIHDSVRKPTEERLRVLAVASTPLTDPRLPEGGLIAELLSASLRAGADAAGETVSPEVGWAPDFERQLTGIVDGKVADVAAPLISASCEEAGELAPSAAVACDRALLSEPIFQVVIGLLIDPKSGFTFAAGESLDGRVVCVPQGSDAGELDRGGRNWVSARKVTLVRPPTLLDCVSVLQRGEADAVLVNEIEARILLQRIGLSGMLRMGDRPIAAPGVYAFVAKEHPKAAELIRSINQGLQAIKRNGAYAAIVERQLAAFLEIREGSP